MERLILVKLGGSLITDKTKPYTAKPKIIARLARELKNAIVEGPRFKLIIGNGAGSFAHQSAKKFDTKNGFHDENGRYGYCVVQNDAATLNRIVVSELLKQKLPVVGFQPSAVMMAKNKSSHFVELTVLHEYINKGIIPVIYGDPVLDLNLGSTIYSTDVLMDLICEEFIKKYNYTIEVINMGNYDGVLDSNNKLIRKISNLKDVMSHLYETNVVDVTGGMKTKIENMLHMAELGCKSLIVNGMIEGNLYKALIGEPVNGTVISK